MMQKRDLRAFLDGLVKMAVLFDEELSELRQRLYWEVLRDEVTIDEWCQACWHAMRRETFHKVPLPATLIEYAREYRREQRLHDVALTPGLRDIRDDPIALEELHTLMANVFQDDRLHDPIPPSEQEDP